MNPRLFTVPVSTPPRLLVARRRIEAAERAYQKAVDADEEFNGLGIVPDAITLELKAARRELARAEAEVFDSLERSQRA